MSTQVPLVLVQFSVLTQVQMGLSPSLHSMSFPSIWKMMTFVVNHEKLQNPLFGTSNVYFFPKAFSSHIAHLTTISCSNF